MNILLTVVQGSRYGESFQIEPNQTVTFGRTNASNESFADDEHMSSVHFEIANLGDQAELRDRGSTNGTWVNNDRIRELALREGDRFRAGKTVFTVEFVKAKFAPRKEDSAGTFEVESQSGDLPERPIPGTPPAPEGSSFVEPPPLHAPQIRQAVQKASSPIEGSVDFDLAGNQGIQEEPLTPNEIPPLLPRRGQSPISDESSISSSWGLPPSAIPEGTPSESRDSYQILRRRTHQDAADSFRTILDSLARTWCIEMVLHMQKIRVVTPTNILHPLYHWLSEGQAQAYSPSRCSWKEFCECSQIRELLPRLCRADACLVMLGDSSDSIRAQIDLMMNLGVEGFSEADGHLPCYWPSTLMAIVDARGTEVCSKLFATGIFAALFCSPWDGRSIVAISNPRVGETLLTKEFEMTHSLWD